MTIENRTGICVIGAGPAGTTLAARLAQLGHEVVLVERSAFPRRHVGESLSPGVLPLLEVTGALGSIERAGFSRVQSVLVKWPERLERRHDPDHSGMLVDRGLFDELLLDHARALGVRVLQPAVIRERAHDESGWKLGIETDGRRVELRSDFLAVAGGRSAQRLANRRWAGCRTLALFAYWRGRSIPKAPQIEAGTDAWYWGVPLPDGTYNTLVFVDVDRFRAEASAPIAQRFHDLIGRSELLQHCRDVELVSPIIAMDATPYIDEECVSPFSIKIGEAGVALDPLSSSGVQNAMQTALSGSIVINTILRKPESSSAARRFYRDSLLAASERHQRWAATHYATVAVQDGSEFWQMRAQGAEADEDLPGINDRDPDLIADTRIELSPQVAFVDRPCLEGEFVSMKSVVCHPNLADPIAYLGGIELAPLLSRLPGGMTRSQIWRYWSSHMPLETGIQITNWLLANGLLVPRG